MKRTAYYTLLTSDCMSCSYIKTESHLVILLHLFEVPELSTAPEGRKPFEIPATTCHQQGRPGGQCLRI